MSAWVKRKVMEQLTEIDQLRQRVAELEAENARLKESEYNFSYTAVQNGMECDKLREYVAGKMQPMVEALGDVSELLAGIVTSTDISESQRIIVTAIEAARKEL